VANSADLLPPNATPLERALSSAGARLGDVPRPLVTLWDPYACPLPILPWLAWGLSVDRWRQSWGEVQKRDAVAKAIHNARRKGSRSAAMDVLADYDPSLVLIEWWEPGGSGIPYTFTVTQPLDGVWATRASASYAAELFADLERVKPARAHFALRQSVAGRAALPIVAVARALRADRFRATVTLPTPAEDLALQTEQGEPLLGGEGLILEDHG
jgi:phage tail P2-like protein